MKSNLLEMNTLLFLGATAMNLVGASYIKIKINKQ